MGNNDKERKKINFGRAEILSQARRPLVIEGRRQIRYSALARVRLDELVKWAEAQR